MKSFFRKDPTEQLSVGYDAERMTLASNLVRFYLKEGYTVDAIHWAIEYQRGKIFYFNIIPLISI